ncbi:bem46 protein [Conglomerata obtusa]
MSNFYQEIKDYDNDGKIDEEAKKIWTLLFAFTFIILYILYIPFMIQKIMVYHPTFGYPQFESLKETTIGDQTSNIYIIDNKKEIDVVLFGGNMAGIEFYAQIARIIGKHVDCNFIIPVYRGFLASKGRCNEINIMVDMHILKKVMKGRNKKVYVFGHSLGCAVGVYFATLFNVTGLVLINGFYDMKTAVEGFALGKVLSFLVVEKWETSKRIGNLISRILIIASKYDSIIDPKNSEDLAKLCKNGTLYKSDSGDHNNIFNTTTLEKIYEFVKA